MASTIQTHLPNILLVILLLLLVCTSGFISRTASKLLPKGKPTYNLTLINGHEPYAAGAGDQLPPNGVAEDDFVIIDAKEVNTATNYSSSQAVNETLTLQELRELAADEELLEKVATNSMIVGFFLLTMVFVIFCSLICCFRTLLFGPAELIV